MAASIIQLLPDHVANKIAAGEVVQRPASVVKELLENAVDAKASDIKLIVKEAGKTLVQVIDNGLGMNTRVCVSSAMLLLKFAKQKIYLICIPKVFVGKHWLLLLQLLM